MSKELIYNVAESARINPEPLITGLENIASASLHLGGPADFISADIAEDCDPIDGSWYRAKLHVYDENMDQVEFPHKHVGDIHSAVIGNGTFINRLHTFKIDDKGLYIPAVVSYPNRTSHDTVERETSRLTPTGDSRYSEVTSREDKYEKNDLYVFPTGEYHTTGNIGSTATLCIFRHTKESMAKKTIPTVMMKESAFDNPVRRREINATSQRIVIQLIADLAEELLS